MSENNTDFLAKANMKKVRIEQLPDIDEILINYQNIILDDIIDTNDLSDEMVSEIEYLLIQELLVKDILEN
ncbi:MAG: hypothetical protein EPN82_05820 [Bacteroidetes bacterium]|nr:MAG: hypothetical protein EPN82_05820 [Bacteroidota bacterium]